MCLALLDELFDEDVGHAEGGPRLAPGLVERGVESVGRLDDPHPAAAAAHRRLDDHRVAERLRRSHAPPARHDRLHRCRRGPGCRPRAASLRAATLSPSRSSTSGRGPTKAIPAAAQARANSAFSDRKPYPGWIASTSFDLASCDDRLRCSDSCGSARRACRPRRPRRPSSRGMPNRSSWE